MSIDIQSFTSYTSPGSFFTPHNVSFGHVSTSVMECFREGTLNSTKLFESARVRSNANPLLIDFQEETIEIPEGQGISVRLYTGSTIGGGVTFRYYEMWYICFFCF